LLWCDLLFNFILDKFPCFLIAGREIMAHIFKTLFR
jgi:hypothetical protein